jgi:cell wall-associated NlpC family hydrolase
LFLDRIRINRGSVCTRCARAILTAVTISLTFTAAALQPCFAHQRHHEHNRASHRAGRHVYFHVAEHSRFNPHEYAPRDLRTLMSRDAGYDAPANAPITGQVALVTTDNAPIYTGREQGGQLIAKVGKDTPIVVTGQTDLYYAVAMSNHTTGFIAKTDAELQDLQVTASGAESASAAAGQSLSSGGSSDRSQQMVTIESMGPIAKSILQSAVNCMGVVPYQYGGTSASGIDCSAFVQAVFGAAGIKLPRTAAQQANVGYGVPLRDITQWMPGDRMYFQCHHDYVDHTAIYMGNGYFIHATINHNGVSIDKVQTDYYWNHLVAVRRSTELENEIQAAAQVGAPDFESNQE